MRAIWLAILVLEISGAVNAAEPEAKSRPPRGYSLRLLELDAQSERQVIVDRELFISFRDTTLESKTKGDWVAWVGTYEDIVNGREGQYRVRLKKNHKSGDCAYPGVLALPDGTIVTTTYGHWTKDEPPYILSVRLTLKELDELAKKVSSAP